MIREIYVTNGDHPRISFLIILLHYFIYFPNFQFGIATFIKYFLFAIFTIHLKTIVVRFLQSREGMNVLNDHEYIIRPETPADYEGIRLVNYLAFGNKPNESNLIEAIRKSELFIPELSLVAVKDGEIIGHILFSRIFIETNEGEIPTIGLAPMAVKPEFQGIGIGLELVKAGLQACRELGYPHVFVLGHPNFYPKFGFVPSQSSFGIECPFPVGDPYFMAIELKNDSLKDIKGRVKYPPAFETVS